MYEGNSMVRFTIDKGLNDGNLTYVLRPQLTNSKYYILNQSRIATYELLNTGRFRDGHEA